MQEMIRLRIHTVYTVVVVLCLFHLARLSGKGDGTGQLLTHKVIKHLYNFTCLYKNMCAGGFFNSNSI